MARYEASVTSSSSPEAVFDYLSDLRSVEEWDPGIRSARLVDGNAGEVGATYQVVASILGRAVPLGYRTEVVERPARARFVAETPTVVISDTLTVTVAAGRTVVTWEAEARPRGLLRLLDPILALLFKRIGDNGRDGLAARLREPLPGEVHDPVAR